jgi:hypothetical protein
MGAIDVLRVVAREREPNQSHGSMMTITIEYCTL